MIVIDRLDGVEEHIIEQMKELLEKQIIKSFSEVLNLSTLDFLYFPNDFDKSLLEFQIEQGMSERGSTNNAMGTAVGKTMEIRINGKLKSRIFFRKEILLHLFFGEENEKTLSWNTIHHELCHVHEQNDLANMVEFQDELVLKSNTIESVLNEHAMNIFSEYIVPKMAVTTKDHNNIVNIDFLTEMINYTQDEIKKDIEKYQNGVLETLSFFWEFQLKTSHLLKVFSTTIGELDGIAKDLAVINETQLDRFISNYQISDGWFSLKSALRQLNRTYPHWEKNTDIEPLKDCILNIWNNFGVYPDDSGIRIMN